MTPTQGETESPSTRRKIRLPRWLKIVLAAFAALVILSLIFGDPEDDPASSTAQSGSSSSVTTPPATTTSAPPVNRYTVVEVDRADRVRVRRLRDGAEVVVRVAGIRAPVPVDVGQGIGCYGPESLSWAKKQLEGATVIADLEQPVRDETERVHGRLTMNDGSRYGVMAARAGRVKPDGKAGEAAPAADIRAAAQQARSAGNGLWGSPCFGEIAPKAPKPEPEPAPEPEPEPQREPQPEPAPEPTNEPAPAPAYYENCDAVRAAGQDPLHAGEPGYSRKLDRDGDGVACE